MERGILIAAFLIFYWNISGLATTNMLRLTKGNRKPVLSNECTCDSCGAKIPPFFQLPILSYIVCGGRCRSCHTKIPVYPLILEISVMAGMFAVAALAGFTAMGVLASFLYYELVRIAVVAKLGRREEGFARQYVIAVLSMLPFCLILLFVSLLYQIV